MSVDRFFARLEGRQDGGVRLTPDESHHCLRVMRKRVGDEVEVFDGEGRWARGVVAAAEGERVVVEIREEGFSPPTKPQITLAVGIPKGKTMELIVQKAVELGVGAIQPLVTEHGVVRVDGAEAARKGGKWQRVALEACKQCGQNVMPVVNAPVALESWLRTREDGPPGLIGSLAEDAVALREGIAGLPRALAALDVMIGPEGDFAPDEIGAARRAGFVPVTFGEITLRVETAVMFCLSVLNYELRRGP